MGPVLMLVSVLSLQGISFLASLKEYIPSLLFPSFYLSLYHLPYLSLLLLLYPTSASSLLTLKLTT